MKRTVTIEIAGKKYPLRETLHVLEWIQEKYGDLPQMLESMVSGASQVGALLDIMAKLMEQGAAYENRFGDPDADFERNGSGGVTYLSRDDLGLICDDDYLGPFITAILNAFDLARKTEIEGVETTEAKKSKKKVVAIHEATK